MPEASPLLSCVAPHLNQDASQRRAQLQEKVQCLLGEDEILSGWPVGTVLCYCCRCSQKPEAEITQEEK